MIQGLRAARCEYRHGFRTMYTHMSPVNTQRRTVKRAAQRPWKHSATLVVTIGMVCGVWDSLYPYEPYQHSRRLVCCSVLQCVAVHCSML